MVLPSPLAWLIEGSHWVHIEAACKRCPKSFLLSWGSIALITKKIQVGEVSQLAQNQICILILDDWLVMSGHNTPEKVVLRKPPYTQHDPTSEVCKT